MYIVYIYIRRVLIRIFCALLSDADAASGERVSSASYVGLVMERIENLREEHEEDLVDAARAPGKPD